MWKVFFAERPLPDSIVALSGRIEGDDSAISAKTCRVLDIKFREGDTVKAGDVIATLDDQQVRAREDQARAAVSQAEAQLRSAQDQIAVLNEQLSETQLESGQATADAEGRVNQAQAELAAAESDLAQQKASLQLAVYDRDAYTRLAKSGAVSERQGKQAETSAASQEAVVQAAERKVESARGALNIAKAQLANPSIRNAQSSAIRKQILQQQAVIANAKADEARSQANSQKPKENRGDLVVRAPLRTARWSLVPPSPANICKLARPSSPFSISPRFTSGGFVPEASNWQCQTRSIRPPLPGFQSHATG